jgi:hypothetical protein
MAHKDPVKVAKALNKAVTLLGQLDFEVGIEEVVKALEADWQGPEWGKKQTVNFVRLLDEMMS